MATLRRHLELSLPAAQAWDAVRDFGALHTRLVPGFVTAATLEEGGAVRALTFANGVQVRERLVSSDDAARRLAYTTEGGRARHYHAVVEVHEAGGGCRLQWTVDLLPDDLAPAIGGMMDLGVQAMRRALGG